MSFNEPTRTISRRLFGQMDSQILLVFWVGSEGLLGINRKRDDSPLPSLCCPCPAPPGQWPGCYHSVCSRVPHAQREERQKADVIFEIILCDEISSISQQGGLLSGRAQRCVCSSGWMLRGDRHLWETPPGAAALGSVGPARSGLINLKHG